MGRRRKKAVTLAGCTACRSMVLVRRTFLFFVLFSGTFCISTEAQTSDAFLPTLAKTQLDSAASRVAEKIRHMKFQPLTPKVLVIDFSRQFPDETSRLGMLLADRFTDSLRRIANGLEVMDCEVFKNYLEENWINIEDLRSLDVCLKVARELGATGIIRANIFEAPDHQLKVSFRVTGFGPAWSEEALLPLTEEMRVLLFQPGLSYVREPDTIPAEPDVLKWGAEGTNGVSRPSCISCPSPGYNDLARTAKFQGMAVLSAVVTTEGKVTSIYVIKGVPFGLTRNAIDAVKGWQFKPALKADKPIAVRVAIQVTFRLL